MKRATSPISPLANRLDEAGGQLRVLLDRLVAIKALDSTVSQLLPASLQNQIHAGNVTVDTLELTCDNAATATRLRYLQTEILNRLQQQGYPHIQKLAIKLRAKF